MKLQRNLLSACACLAAANMAIAQDTLSTIDPSAPQTANSATSQPVATPDITLPRIDVWASPTSDDAATEGTGSYAAENVSLFKATRDPLTLPSTISVLTNQELSDRNISETRDAILQLPGISVQRIGESDTYHSRAYELNTQVDGIPLEAGSMSNIYDTAIYDRVEILRGPAGTLQGKSNIGGVVNLARKRPTTELQAIGNLSYGSWAQRHGSLDVGGSLNAAQTVRGRVVAALQNRDYFYDFVNTKSRSFYGVLEIDITPDTMLGFTASRAERERKGQYFGVPQALTWTGERSRYFGQTWTGGDFTSSDLGFDLTHKFDSGWQGVMKGLYRDSEHNYRYHQPISVGSFAMHRFNNLDGNAKNYSLDTYFTGPLHFLGRKHQLTAGVNFNKYHNVYGSASGQALDFTANPARQYPEPTWGTLNYTANKTRQWGAYAQGEFELISERLYLNTGGRISNYTHQYKNDGQTSFTDYGTTKGRFTPYAGLVYKPTENSSLYISYADVFEPQTQTDFYGNILKPVIGGQYEVGAKGEFLDGALKASIAYYDLDEKNKPVRDANPAHINCGGMGYYCYVAAGRINSRGVDVEVSGSPIDDLQLHASYNYNINKYEVDDYAQNQPYIHSAPKHQFKFWGNYQFGDKIRESQRRWNIGLGVRAQSRTSFDADSVEYGQGSHAVYDAQIGYQFSRNASLRFSVNNLFDRKYLESVYLYNFYGEPRNYMLTFRVETD